MSNTIKVPACPKCGALIPPGAPEGLCPKCVLVAAATVTSAARAMKVGRSGRRAFTSGSCSTLTKSALSLRTISRGVALGTTTPKMLRTLNPGMVSATVGMSGAIEERLGPAAFRVEVLPEARRFLLGR